MKVQMDITRQAFGVTLIQFVLFAALFWACSYSGSPGPLPGFGSIYIPGDFINGYANLYPHLAQGASLVLLFINAFIIIRTISRNLVYPSRTYLPAIFYLFVSCGIVFPGYDLAAMLSSYLVVCATVAFISSFVRTVSFGTTFRGAFLVGLTPLLEPQNAVYLLLVPIAMLVFRRCARETTVAILGSIFPLFLAGYTYWVLGHGFTGVFVSIWEVLVSPDPSGWALAVMDTATIVRIASAGVIALVLLLSAVTFLSMASDIRTRAYKVQVFALWFLLLAAASMALPSRSAANFTIAAIPASIIGPAFFVRFLGMVPYILYIIMCLAMVAGALAPVFFF